MTFLKESRLKLLEWEPLSKHTSWKMGGNARYFASPTQLDQLVEVMHFCMKEKLAFYVLGRGSNVLFSDEEYSGVVISLLNLDKNHFEVSGNEVEVSAGVLNSNFVLRCAEENLGGLEFLSSIPGTVGGSVAQNAGFGRSVDKKSEIGRFVTEVLALTPEGKEKLFTEKDLEFSYRNSNLRNFLIIRVKLKCEPKEKEIVQKEILENYQYRSKIQDLQSLTAGSVFKNPSNSEFSAGQLIEKVGLKGYRLGNVQVSEKHANFFVNLGGARSEEMLELIKLVKKKVLDEFGFSLKEEIRYVNFK